MSLKCEPSSEQGQRAMMQQLAVADPTTQFCTDAADCMRDIGLRLPQPPFALDSPLSRSKVEGFFLHVNWRIVSIGSQTPGEAALDSLARLRWGALRWGAEESDGQRPERTVLLRVTHSTSL